MSYDYGSVGQHPAEKEEDLVSVIIPTHNRAQLLRRAIASVQAQTHSNLKIIVVDDGSTDETKEVVEAINEPRLLYLRHKLCRGGSAARNAGLRNSTGKYIAFLDDDDEWISTKTQEQIDVLKNCDAVLCGKYQEGRETRSPRKVYDINQSDLCKGKYTSGGTGALMAKSKVFESMQFDESLPRLQDWDLFIRISANYSIRYMDRGLVRYNPGAHSRITNRIVNQPVSEIGKQLVMLHKHRSFFGEKWFKRHMARMYLFGVMKRPDRFQHLVYATRNFGVQNVLWTLSRRLKRKWFGW